MNSVTEIQQVLIGILKDHQPVLKVTMDAPEKFEVTGTIPTMQGKKSVDGFYFASVVPKPKDVRLYFFPVYTHKEQVGDLPADLKKCLKGKSCFHIKKLDNILLSDIKSMVEKSIKIYQEDGLLAK